MTMRMLTAMTVLLCTTALAPADVTIKTVKYADLKELVLQNRGKVVYVEFWHNL